MDLVSDICEISDENKIISCLKDKFVQDHIYVSKNLKISPVHKQNKIFR